MAKMRYPSILIGLGDAGVDIVSQVNALVEAGDPELAALTRTLALTARGLHEAGDPVPTAGDGSPPPAGSEPGVALGEAPGAGAWAANYAALLGAERAIRQRLERAVHAVRSYARGVDAARRDVALGHDVTFYLVGSLCDPVGSAALVPVLAIVHQLFDQAFRGMHPRVQAVLLSHDLLPEGPAAHPLLKARAYAALQELEWVFDGGLRLGHLVGADLVWLLSSRNEENLFLGGYAELVPVIAHQLLTMLRGEVLGDVSAIRTALVDQVADRATRYSTFGFSQLAFPRERLLERATDALVAQALADLPALAEPRIETGELAGEVERFVYAERFQELLAALGRDEAGNDIWAGYTPGPRVLEEENAASLLHALDAYDVEFEQRQAPEMQRRIGARRAALLVGQRERIARYVDAEILEAPERGTLAEAEAWLAALVGDTTDRTHGEVALGTETLGVVDRDLDRYFEPLLFGGGTDDAPEYAARISSASGRRRLLRQVKRELDEKVGALLHHQALQRGREEELDGLGGEEASPPGPGATDGRTVGGGEEGSAVVPAESAASLADEAAAQAAAVTQLLVTRAELESDARYVVQLEAEVAALTPVYARVHGEVTRLDHTIRNASERRRIFLARLDELQAQAAKAREAFVQADQAYRAKRAELAEWADHRRAWLWKMVAAWAAGLLAAAGLAVRYPVLRELSPEAYAAILGVAAAFTAALYWARIGRRYRELREQTAQALVRRNAARDQLVQARLRLRREIYEYDRYDALVDWRDELTGFVRTLRGQARACRDELLALARRSAAAAERLDLAESPFLEYLLPPGGVAGLLERHADAAGLQLREMWREAPVTAVFAEFRAATGDDRLAPLLARVRARAAEVFAGFRGLSAERFFAESVPEGERPVRIERLYRNAAPFAPRLGEEGGDSTVRLTYVGLTDPPGESAVRASLTQAESARFYVGQVDTEVSVLRLAMAFPAFQFAPMEEARSVLESLDAADRPGLYLDPAWVAELRDLKPSALRLGGADDALRRLGCLALAHGCADEVASPAGPRIRFHGAEFPRYDAWVLHLGTLAGARDRRAVEAELAALRARGATEAPSARERLAAYRDAHPLLDPVDREIIDDEIVALDSLDLAAPAGDAGRGAAS